MSTPLPTLLSWPLSGIDRDGRLDWARDDAAIRASLLNILLTRPGERLQRPDFGAGILNFVHQPNSETTRGLLAGVIRKSVALWEPRVVVEQVEVRAATDNPAEVRIDIRYRPRHSNTPAELGFTLDLGQV